MPPVPARPNSAASPPDSCLLAMESYENGEKLPGLTTDARTYSAGAGLMPDGFDENIIGMDVVEVAPRLDPSLAALFAARKIITECWAHHYFKNLARA